MQRRRFLCTAAALLAVPFAGCADRTGALELTAVEDWEIARRASRSPKKLSDEENRIVDDLIANGSATSTGRSPGFETDEPVRVDERYYNVSSRITGTFERESFAVLVDFDDVDPEGLKAVEFAELSAADRDFLDGLVPPPSDAHTRDGYEMGSVRTYTDEEMADSVLVPTLTVDAGVYDGRAYRLKLDGSHTVTFHEYDYTSSLIADSDDEYGGRIRERCLFTLSGLSDAERNVVEKGIENRYYVNWDDDGVEALAKRLQGHRAVRSDDYDGNWLVEYDGVVYWLELENYPFETLESNET